MNRRCFSPSWQNSLKDGGAGGNLSDFDSRRLKKENSR